MGRNDKVPDYGLRQGRRCIRGRRRVGSGYVDEELFGVPIEQG